MEVEKRKRASSSSSSSSCADGNQFPFSISLLHRFSASAGGKKETRRTPTHHSPACTPKITTPLPSASSSYAPTKAATAAISAGGEMSPCACGVLASSLSPLFVSACHALRCVSRSTTSRAPEEAVVGLVERRERASVREELLRHWFFSPLDLFYLLLLSSFCSPSSSWTTILASVARLTSQELSHGSSIRIGQRDKEAKERKREREKKSEAENRFFHFFCKSKIKKSLENVQQLVPRRRVGSGVLPLGLLRLDARAVLSGLLALEGGANLLRVVFFPARLEVF